jgi:sugar/nucleoside kinase (ribokinase family)
MSEVLNLASVVKAVDTELQTINDATGMDVHELIRVHHINEFVVTAGSLGGSVFLASGEEVRYQAMPAPLEGDPTGAGDVFFAAYIASRLNRKLDVVDSCRHAAEVAAMQVSGQYIRDEQLAL